MYNSHFHRRKTLRLQCFDYTSENAYFVTLCTQNRECIYGYIENGHSGAGTDLRVCLNDAGEMVKEYWIKLATKFQNIQLDEYIIMPNHLHGNIKILGADPCVCPVNGQMGANRIHGKCGGEGEQTGTPLHRIIQWYKTMTTNEYIRNENELGTIRHYIRNNPLHWDYVVDNSKKL